MKRFLLIIGLLFLPSSVYAMQNTPTDYGNNVTGRLKAQISTTKASGITVTADSFRTPGGTASVTFPTGPMILKLSRKVGSLTLVEYIGVESASQSSDTVTLGTTTRYISPTDGTTFVSQGAGLSFPSGSIVELNWAVQQGENTLFKNNVNELTGSGRITKAGSGSAIINIPSVTTTERDAFEVTKVGDVIRNETLGIWQIYEPGEWVAFSSGAVVNAGYATAGKVEFGTLTEIFNQTASGSSNAGLAVAVKDVVHNSGATTATNGYSNVAGTSGSLIDVSLIATSPGSGDLLQVQGNGDITGRSTTQLGISTGFKHEATVTTASANVGANSTATGMLLPVWTGTGVDTNTLVVGSVIHVKLGGQFDIGAGVLFLQMRVGDVLAAVWQVDTAPTSTAAGWYLDSDITVRSIGASASVIAAGNATFSVNISNPDDISTAHKYGVGFPNPTAVTVDTTVPLHITFYVRPDTSNGSNYMNIQTGSITVTRP